jgi:hypothetical protein
LGQPDTFLAYSAAEADAVLRLAAEARAQPGPHNEAVW